jgi:HK97 gp10 family phage protein
MSADQNIKGLADVLNRLSTSPIKMHGALRVGLYVGAQLIEAEAKSNCPVESGSLRDSIRTSIKYADQKIIAVVKAGGKVQNGARVGYAHLIEFTGAAPHVIKSKDGKAISFGGHAYESINHPGMKAKPFLRPALDAKRAEAIAACGAAIAASLKGK